MQAPFIFSVIMLDCQKVTVKGHFFMLGFVRIRHTTSFFYDSYGI